MSGTRVEHAPADATLVLAVGETSIRFERVALAFSGTDLTNIFAGKNNKSVQQTLCHRRYSALVPTIVGKHDNWLQAPLGEFLAFLKGNGDPLYLRFLNSHGDKSYCRFRLADAVWRKKRGLYCFTGIGSLKYIGKSVDSFGKRVDQGYGQIHPKNCYRDGQSTNCHLNALIEQLARDVSFFAASLDDTAAIDRLELALIAKYRPPWNVQLGA
jgi:hypothetical protein